VGMETVRKSLAKINGSLTVESELDVLTRFTIKLPLTLAIISALMVEVSGEQYAIPLTLVDESIKINRNDIHNVNNHEIVKVRDRVLQLVHLGHQFGLPVLENDTDQLYVVLVQTRFGEVGLIVDSLIGQQDVVIKPLTDYFQKVKGIAGATILGNGRVVLIVDVHTLLEFTKQESDTVSIREGKA
jgi:two-component system chemotaxis sensor kinase CheA